MNGSVEATEHGTNGTYKVKDDRPQSQTPVDDVASSKKVLVQEYPEGQKEGSCTSCCAPEGRPVFVFFRLLVVILAGIVFGWCLEKGRVFEPASIRLQMVFRRWVMMKMFMAAVGSGQLVLALMSIFPGIKDKMLKAMEEYGGCFSEKGLLTSILGPFILGMGMTLSGACPGMVLAQVGSWTNNAIYTFIGTLIGALLYGLVAPFVIRLTRPKKPFEILTVHEKLNVRYVYLALPMALAIGVVVFLLEYFIPWQDDIDCWNRNEFATPGANIFTMKSWSPGVSGAVIGVLQVAIVLAVGDTLGGSSSYVTIVSQWVITERLQSMFPYLARARCGIGNWWQVFYVLAAVAGGALSSWGSDSIGTAPGVSVTTAIFGGILLLLGARLAAGCTSGHGLSGMGLLYWFSFLAVPAMFAGGIALAFAMDATGALSDYHFHDVAFDIPLENCANFTMN